MTQDTAVLWQNNEHAQTLFYDLLARAERGAYDDDFIAQLAAYRAESEDTARADIFAAEYLLHHYDAESAALCGERAFRRRPIEPRVWAVLSRAYAALGRYADALIMQGYETRITGGNITCTYPPETFTQETLDLLSVAMGKPSYAPFAVRRMAYTPEEGLTESSTAFSGEFLPVSPQITPPYYVGVYTEQEQQGTKAWLLATIRSAEGFACHLGGDFLYDIIRGDRAPGRAEIHLDAGQEVILPVLGSAAYQRLQVTTPSLDKETPLTPATPNFFRLSEETVLSSDQTFIVGRPIAVGHAAHRRPLVLNIFADALPWQIVREHFAAWMPRTARFFAHGTVFDQHFSTSEYTYPVLPAVETGLYPHHTHMFNDKVAIPLDADIPTLAEQLRAQGYATANLMGDGVGIYNETTRGYDRLIVSGYRNPAYEGVEHIIRHLEGIRDADHFILIQTSDVHPWAYPTFQITSSVQARLPLAARLSGAEDGAPSPYLRATPLAAEACRQGIRDLDRALGALYDYLEENYAEEEYLVTLYSDHGVPVFTEDHYIVSPELTRAAWMMRGAGVPAGIACDEMTSAVDIYPTLAHLLHFPLPQPIDGVLPQLFGGPGRETAFSSSLYPGRTFCLRARTLTHTFHLETRGGVLPNGTVDLAHAETAIYPRAHEGLAGHDIDSAALRAFFYPRVRDFLREISNNGEAFPLPKEA